MTEEYDYSTWLKSLSHDEYIAAIRSEILNCNQTTRTNLSYILSELSQMSQDMLLDSGRVLEYVERIRSTTDRITSLLNTAVVLYAQTKE
jgi:hypothetical protein